MQPTLRTSEALLLSLWRKGTMVTRRRITLEISRWESDQSQTLAMQMHPLPNDKYSAKPQK